MTSPYNSELNQYPVTVNLFLQSHLFSTTPDLVPTTCEISKPEAPGMRANLNSQSECLSPESCFRSGFPLSAKGICSAQVSSSILSCSCPTSPPHSQPPKSQSSTPLHSQFLSAFFESTASSMGCDHSSLGLRAGFSWKTSFQSLQYQQLPIHSSH